MLCISLLAQASPQGAESLITQTVDYVWQHVESLSWLQAIIAITFGAVLMFHGWQIFKTLVIISFAMLGLFLGVQFGEVLGSTLWPSIVAMLLLGLLSIPLMRWAVCILGAVAGGVLTSGLWYALHLPQQYILAGTLIGVVAGGMISFIIFKAAVMLFTSLQGGIVVLTGMLALFRAYAPTADSVKSLYFEHQWFAPFLLIAITALGILVQARMNSGVVAKPAS